MDLALKIVTILLVVSSVPLSKASPKPTLIVDLDGTLVYACFGRWTLKGVDEPKSVYVGDDAQTLRLVYVLPRPGAVEFINAANEIYNIVVFTHGKKWYADALLSVIDPNGLIRFRLYRESTTEFVNLIKKNIGEALIQIRNGNILPFEMPVSTTFGSNRTVAEQDLHKVSSGDQSTERFTNAAPGREMKRTAQILDGEYILSRAILLDDTVSTFLPYPKQGYLISEWAGCVQKDKDNLMSIVLPFLQRLVEYLNTDMTRSVDTFPELESHQEKIKNHALYDLSEIYKSCLENPKKLDRGILYEDIAKSVPKQANESFPSHGIDLSQPMTKPESYPDDKSPCVGLSLKQVHDNLMSNIKLLAKMSDSAKSPVPTTNDSSSGVPTNSETPKDNAKETKLNRRRNQEYSAVGDFAAFVTNATVMEQKNRGKDKV